MSSHMSVLKTDIMGDVLATSPHFVTKDGK